MKQKATELLKKDIGILLQKHSESVLKGDIGSAINIMKDIDFSLAQLNKLDGIEIETNETQDENGFLNWYEVLKFFIETEQSQLIELGYSSINEEMKHRGTGKTTALLQLAHDYNLPIIVNSAIANVYRDKIKELGLKVNMVTDLSKLSMAQYKNIDTILIDENTNSRFIGSKYKIIGFQSKN